jgi:GT2 family glycosyltransferase
MLTPISICTAVWNELPHTKAFVKSLKKNPRLNFELIIVDNGSDPNDESLLRKFADVYYRFSKNEGFCKGFNKAASLCRNEYVLLTNNDTIWPDINWQEILINEFNQSKKCGLLFPCANNILCDANKRNSAGHRRYKLPKWHLNLCAGVAIFTRKAIFNYLGGFDESYVTSGEDMDLQFKAWDKGYEVYVTEKVFIEHFGKATSRHLPDWEILWDNNWKKVLAKWQAKIRRPSPALKLLIEKLRCGIHALKHCFKIHQ